MSAHPTLPGTTPDRPAVGVLGLGAMGAPIARHLLGAGLAVSVLDLDVAVVETAVAAGATAVDDLVTLAATCPVVLIVLPSDEDVHEACLGPAGLLSQGGPSGAVVICSSVRPETCRAVAERAPAGTAVLDAALTGGVRGAEAGEINLLVGGDAADLDRLGPVLEPWTKAVHLLGPLGAGQVGKTANNLVHWAQIAAITEALELARRAGLSVPRLREALMDGPTDSRTLRELEQMRLTWHVKDLANTAVLADRVGMDVPVAETARQVMLRTTVDDVAELLQADGARSPAT